MVKLMLPVVLVIPHMLVTNHALGMAYAHLGNKLGAMQQYHMPRICCRRFRSKPRKGTKGTKTV
jgi:membrane protein YqaA with SNARE-associated domain